MKWRNWIVAGLALAVLVVLAVAYVRHQARVPRENAIGKYFAGESNWDDDLDLREDGTYAYSFRPRGGAAFALAGGWEFEEHAVTPNVVILHDFAPKCGGAPEGKRHWRFTLVDDSGLYRLEAEDPSQEYAKCPAYERLVK